MIETWHCDVVAVRVRERKTLVIELVTSDNNLKASRQGSESMIDGACR